MALFLVATPIGTLDDCSPRAREVLGSAAVIAAEDTRNTRKLLTALGISAPPIVALHAHNEASRADELVERARDEDVVLVSDAGTPVVSDPGALVVARAHAAGIEVRSVPGPSALAAALALSGFSAVPSTFVGFPPRKGRKRWARELLGRSETLVLFEAPGRVAGLVADLAAHAPQREAALCREISKRYEEVRRGPLAALDTEDIRGECVLVVGPGEAVVEDRVELDARGLKDVAAFLAKAWDRPKRDVYQALLALKDDL